MGRNRGESWSEMPYAQSAFSFSRAVPQSPVLSGFHFLLPSLRSLQRFHAALLHAILDLQLCPVLTLLGGCPTSPQNWNYLYPWPSGTTAHGRLQSLAAACATS